jgi:two-component system sensor histidine kinase QseC
MNSTKSLHFRLTTLVLSLAALLWLGAAGVAWLDAKHQIDELLDGHLAQAAALLVLQAHDADEDVSDARSLHKYAPQVAFQVFVGNQLETRSSNVGNAPMSSITDGFSSFTDDKSETWRVYATHDAKRDLTVYVGEKTLSREAILWAVMRSVMWPLLIVLPLFGVATWWSVRKGLSPLGRISREIEHRPVHALDPLPLSDLPSELRPLVTALNTLLDRTSRLMLQERRFTADAAHELRTPIAGIRAQAQVALGAGENRAEREHALQLTLAGCDRVTRLVEQLLTLARLEVATSWQSERTDLSAVARQVAGTLAPAALARHQLMELDAEPSCFVVAEESLLGVLVRNLIDNAVRYSPDGARLLISVSQAADAVVLKVQDSGPGMDDGAISRLGERFFRVLGSEQPGSGLGWSIVRRLADVFGAHISVERCQQLGGLCVTVRWPTA